jgi:hypothetical protein
MAGIIRNMGVAENSFSSVIMLSGMCVLVVVFMRTGMKISRAEGATLVAIGLIRWILDFVT